MKSRIRCISYAAIFAVSTGGCISRGSGPIPSPDALISSGNIHYENKRWAEASAYYFQFLKNYKKHPAAEGISFKYGYVLLFQATEMEHSIIAAQHFKGFQSEYPRSKNAPQALYWAAAAYLVANDGKKAHKYFTRLIREYPKTKWAKYAAGRIHNTGTSWKHVEHE